jgi:uncharacterized protein YycO
MSKVKVVFTISPWSPASWFIRWVLPRSRWSIALSSHCIIIQGDHAWEALPGGVRCNSVERAMEGCKEVASVEYDVPNADAAYEFLNRQLGKPYDWRAAMGLGLLPGREWTEDDSWYCYELAAGALRAGGLDIFKNISYITETALLAIK